MSLNGEYDDFAVPDEHLPNGLKVLFEINKIKLPWISHNKNSEKPIVLLKDIWGQQYFQGNVGKNKKLDWLFCSVLSSL